MLKNRYIHSRLPSIKDDRPRQTDPNEKSAQYKLNTEKHKEPNGLLLANQFLVSPTPVIFFPRKFHLCEIFNLGLNVATPVSTVAGDPNLSTSNGVSINHVYHF